MEQDAQRHAEGRGSFPADHLSLIYLQGDPSRQKESANMTLERATAPSKILVIGSLNMDLVAVAPRIPVISETIIGTSFLSEPGGKGANQAYAAAQLGGNVAMLGSIGNDEFGKQMRKNLEAVGCDASKILVEPGSSGIALIFVDSVGQNSIIVVPGANNALTPQHVASAFEHLADVKIVLLQLEIPIESVLAAAQAARRLGATVILDPAPAPASALPVELLRNVDILTPNETEAAILAGLAPANLEPAQAAEIGKRLLRMGASLVVLKLGSQGCMIVDEESSVLIPAPIVEAKDTTAAGDVFNAGLAVALSEGLDLSAACRFANHAAALSVTRFGAQAAAPHRTDVDRFIADGSAETVVTLKN
jgi:ribokinase